MKLVLRSRVAGLAVSICALLAVQGTAQAYTVTLHIHGAGTVAETTARNLPGCSISPSGLSNSSVTDCVMGAASGFWNFGDVVNLAASTDSVASSRGWVFDRWVDGSASGQIDCDDNPAHVGDRSSPNCQFQIFQNLYIDLYFHDLAGPQDTRFTSAAQPSPTGATSASFTFDAPSDPDALFQCKLDRPGQLGSYASCSQSLTYSGLTSGQYTLTVRGLDRSGNFDQTPVSRTWTVDATPPTTTISGGPADGSMTNSRTAAFSLSASEVVSRYECALDGAAFATCPSTPSYSSLGDGSHTLQARSLDPVSNVGAAATRTWTVDATPPETSISSGPADGSSTSARASSFAFTSEPGASFQCALDGGAFGGCTSPFGTPALADGAHSFAVRAIDAAGNVDASPATRGWTVSTPTSTTTTTSTSSTNSGTQSSGDGPAVPAVVPVVAIAATPIPRAAPGAVSVSWFVTGAKTSAKSLKVSALRSGSTVHASCKGKGCPFRSKTLTAKAGKVDFTKSFKGRKLAKGAVLELRVAASGLLTRVFTYKVRAGSAPSRATGCLAAGASEPGACPA